MAAIKTLFVLIFAGLVAIASAGEDVTMIRGAAEEDHRELKKKKYVKVYNEEHFGGDYLELEPGLYDWDYLAPNHFNDRIHSIKLPRGYKALMCSDPELRGECRTFKYSDGYVHLGDGVSSLKIMKKW